MVGDVCEYGESYKGGVEVRGGRKKEEVIHFGSYSIHNGRNVSLESALSGIAKDNIVPGVFQETNITGGIYTQELAGYRVDNGS